MNRFHNRDRSKVNGFTLIEMLVAVAVLALLTVMITQVISMVSKAISNNVKKLDGITQARLALDCIGTDLSSRPRRSDLDMQLTKAPGNDQIEFYSEVGGYSGDRHFSIVGYRVQETATDHPFQFERGVQGTYWNGTTSVSFLPQTLPVISDDNYEVVANSIFRFEFCYLKMDGSYSNVALSDFSDVSAIVIAVAVLDITSRKVVTSSQLQQLAAALPDVPEGQIPLSVWHTEMSKPSFGQNIPQQAVQSIRLYQRFFYVP